MLRIHPEPDGSYTVPAGNLFLKAPTAHALRYMRWAAATLTACLLTLPPAIITLGRSRSDAGQDGDQGATRIRRNQPGKKPGNFGWPFVVGDNKVYPQYDFATKTIGAPFKAEAPVNNSPNNSGLKVLPPAQKAMIWYPYDSSAVFPQLGNGGPLRNGRTGIPL